MTSPFDFSGRIALVTGASRGIGYFAAKHLAAAGAHVIAVARTVGGLEELDDEIKAAGGPKATLVPLDLADMPGIDRLGGAINERWGKLDILVANAGVLGTISPIGHVEAKTFEKVMTINVTSTWRLIRSVDPLLRQSDAGRAIVVTSNAAHSARAFWGPYAASKAAVEHAHAVLGERDGEHEAARQRLRSGPDPHGHAGAGNAGRGREDAPASFRCRREDASARQPCSHANGPHLSGQTRPFRRIPRSGIILALTSL